MNTIMAYAITHYFCKFFTTFFGHLIVVVIILNGQQIVSLFLVGNSIIKLNVRNEICGYNARLIRMAPIINRFSFYRDTATEYCMIRYTHTIYIIFKFLLDDGYLANRREQNDRSRGIFLSLVVIFSTA